MALSRSAWNLRRVRSNASAGHTPLLCGVYILISKVIHWGGLPITDCFNVIFDPCESWFPIVGLEIPFPGALSGSNRFEDDVGAGRKIPLIARFTLEGFTTLIALKHFAIGHLFTFCHSHSVHRVPNYAEAGEH